MLQGFEYGYESVVGQSGVGRPASEAVRCRKLSFGRRNVLRTRCDETSCWQEKKRADNA